jgi:hypothetical protein
MPCLQTLLCDASQGDDDVLANVENTTHSNNFHQHTTDYHNAINIPQTTTMHAQMNIPKSQP